jgi:FtsH-binding integral membrane protein
MTIDVTTSSSTTGSASSVGTPVPSHFKAAALSCALLAAIMLLAAGGVAKWLESRHGAPGMAAAGVAWMLCFGASLAALLISVSFAHTPHAMAANLGTMLLRMGVPLVGLVALPELMPSLAGAGLGTAILILYLVGLAAETMLAVRHVVPTSSAARRGGSRSNTEVSA